jgi:hypothetical protein
VSARQVELVERRKALLARSEENRAELGVIVGGLERKFAVADAVVAAARKLSRYRGLIGAAGLFLILKPVAARKWVRRATWLLPLALQAFRMFKGHDEEPRARPDVEANEG